MQPTRKRKENKNPIRAFSEPVRDTEPAHCAKRRRPFVATPASGKRESSVEFFERREKETHFFSQTVLSDCATSWDAASREWFKVSEQKRRIFDFALIRDLLSRHGGNGQGANARN